jgi:hypothetical protein
MSNSSGIVTSAITWLLESARRLFVHRSRPSWFLLDRTHGKERVAHSNRLVRDAFTILARHMPALTDRTPF